MITTYIIDDQPGCINSLSKDLSVYPEVELAGTFASAAEGAKAIRERRPDLLFLDVEMPGKNGLELVAELQRELESTSIVFYTAFDKYMLDAIRASAFDFLLKPYTPEELRMVMDRFCAAKNRPLSPLRDRLQHFSGDQRRFALHSITGLLLLRQSDMVYLDYFSGARCWQLHLADGSNHKLRASTTARELIQMGGNLLQISQDCIVNADYVVFIENSTLRCMLAPPFNHIVLKMSRRCYARLRDSFDIF